MPSKMVIVRVRGLGLGLGTHGLVLPLFLVLGDCIWQRTIFFLTVLVIKNISTSNGRSRVWLCETIFMQECWNICNPPMNVVSNCTHLNIALVYRRRFQDQNSGY